jgi:type IV secretion system protein VirB10
MGLFDRFNRYKSAASPSDTGPGDDSLPHMGDDPATLAQAMQSRQMNDDGRACEQRHAHAAADDDNDGLPSVNRRRRGNKLVTALGFVFILGTAAALIIAVNSDKKPKPKKSQTEEQVTNKLPPILAPTAPPPITVATASPLPSPPPTPPAPLTSPIPVQRGAPAAAKGKPVQDWTERKMAGSLLVGDSGAANTTSPGRDAAPVAARPMAGAEGASSLFGGDMAGRPGAGSDLANRLEPTVTKSVSASLLADRNFLLTKGTTLDCALETALDSSVPGIATCRLTRDVYSDNGQVLLLDRGSQLVGEYQSGLKQGQVRLFVLWSRAKTPNGVVVSLNSPGTDALGRSGLEGWIDNHFAERFGSAILLSLVKDTVTAIANRNGGGSGSTNNYYGNAVTGGEKVVEKILESTVNIPPTIVKNQGDHIQVMVARDLDFSGVYALQPTQGVP